eukprot:scaffold13217_cov106-Skeletonema_marinoi.AAC.1
MDVSPSSIYEVAGQRSEGLRPELILIARSNDRTNISRALHFKIEGRTGIAGLSRHLTLNLTSSHSQRWNVLPSSIYEVAGQRSKAPEDIISMLTLELDGSRAAVEGTRGHHIYAYAGIGRCSNDRTNISRALHIKIKGLSTCASAKMVLRRRDAV